jgi:hypothetical protein
MTVRLLLILSLMSAAVLAQPATRPAKPAKPFVVKKGFKAAELPVVGGRFAFPDAWGVRDQKTQVVYDIHYKITIAGRQGEAHLVTICAEPGATQDLAGMVGEVKDDIAKQRGKVFDINYLKDTKTTLGGRPAWLLVYESAQKGKPANSSQAEIIYFDKARGSARLQFGSHKADWDMLMKTQFQPVIETFNWVD